ncbi:MAG: hypothetical protein MRZ79_22445 [Bacteroidia bacterium]|nr:hypothetical protein [Bacteroidia bacterium]
MIPYRYTWLVCLLACVSCSQSDPQISWEKTQVDNLYTVDLPSNLQPGYEMHDYASLQYYSLEDQIYVLGIEDAKENLGDIKRKRLKLKAYFNFVEKNVLQPMDSSERESQQIYTSKDGYSLRVGDYYANSRKFDWNPLFYRISVYESVDYFLQLVVWMPYDKHCEYMPILDTMTHSVRFLEAKR